MFFAGALRTGGLREMVFGRRGQLVEATGQKTNRRLTYPKATAVQPFLSSNPEQGEAPPSRSLQGPSWGLSRGLPGPPRAFLGPRRTSWAFPGRRQRAGTAEFCAREIVVISYFLMLAPLFHRFPQNSAKLIVFNHRSRSPQYSAKQCAKSVEQNATNPRAQFPSRNLGAELGWR